MKGYSSTFARGSQSMGSFIGTALLILAGVIIFLGDKLPVSLLRRSFR